MNVVRVWDLPTRLFHWTLVLCVVGLVITGEVGGDAMAWHFRLGYTALSLLAFRLVWGWVGGYWSRFTTFVAGPSTILSYLRGTAESHRSVGHNPLGALSVLGLLAFASLQGMAGMFSDDEIAAAGPLTKLVTGDWVSLATSYHTKYGKAVLIVLVVLHLCAIAFYRIHKNENLITPMLTGDKLLSQRFDNSRDDVKSRLFALVVFAICLAAVLGVVRWAS